MVEAGVKLITTEADLAHEETEADHSVWEIDEVDPNQYMVIEVESIGGVALASITPINASNI